ncbi:hypothetical protein NDI39_00420 [Microcoleus sp. ZQ-A2]|nr:hypothetical protein [Microcoleus sp. FACHB-1]
MYHERHRLRSPARGDRNKEKTTSRYFSNINVSDAIAECFQIAYERNTSTAIRELRRKLAIKN